MRKFIFAFFIAFLFISCSNISDGADDGKKDLASDIILCRGSISTAGAMPDSLAKVLSSARAAASSADLQRSENTRAAIPVIDETYTYFAQAISKDGITVDGFFEPESNPKAFRIPLASGKSWTVSCGIKNAEGNIILSDSYPDFTPTAENSVINHKFFLKFNSSGSGEIALTMNADSVIDYAIFSCSDDAWKEVCEGNEDKRLDFSSGSAELSIPSITAGIYQIVIKFYRVDNSDPENPRSILKYVSYQTFTVKDGMKTSAWVSGGNAAEIDSGEFRLRTDLINAYTRKRKVFYVGSVDDANAQDSNEGTALRPFATITQACRYIAEIANKADYTIYVYGTVTGTHEIPNTITEDNAASITIEGCRGLNSSGEPQDVLDGGFTTPVAGGSVLKLTSEVPVTVKNLKITGAFCLKSTDSTGVAGGLYIRDTPVTLENCVITGNKTRDDTSEESIYYCAGVTTSSSLTLKGKNIIKDNFIIKDDDTAPLPSNLYLGSSSKKVMISGSIAGSQIGIYVPYRTSEKPTITSPCVFTEGYRYGVRNTSLPGAIFTAENGYGIVALTSDGNAGEAAFAVSSGGMYSYEDFTFGFAAKESAEAGAANVTQIFPGEARTVYIMPASLKRKESGGSDTDLYYNSTDKKLYLASDHSVKACGDNALEITAALYNGGYKVCDMTTEPCEGGRSVEIPSQSLPGTYVLKVNYTYLGVTKEVNINLECTTDGVAYGLAYIAALPADGGSLALTGTLSADDFTALNDAIKARQTASSSFRVDLDLSAVTELTEIPAGAFQANDALRTVVLPEGITKIEGNAFRDCDQLTTINLPDGLTEIGNSAFYECYKLTDVTLPDTITSIGANGFRNCNLTSVVLPEGLTTLGSDAFESNSKLQSVTIPSTLKTIPRECFDFDSKLTTVIMAEGVENISEWAFWVCSGLISINLPSSIKSIHIRAFDQTKKLEAINVAETNTVYKSIDGVVYKYNDDGSLSFAHYPNAKGTSYVIPSDANVTSIESGFCRWENRNNDLVELTIPVSVTTIKTEAFYSCNNLTTLNYTGTMAQWNAITKASGWKYNSSYGLGATVVHCSDGDVSIE